MKPVKIFTEEETINYSLDHLIEAFNDIHAAICPKHPFYEAVELVELKNQPALRYTVTMTGKTCIKVFDGNQGTPELISDIMTWLFSMLNGAANL